MRVGEEKQLMLSVWGVGMERAGPGFGAGNDQFNSLPRCPSNGQRWEQRSVLRKQEAGGAWSSASAGSKEGTGPTARRGM